jgi:hypothetical protein
VGEGKLPLAIDTIITFYIPIDDWQESYADQANRPKNSSPINQLNLHRLLPIGQINPFVMILCDNIT